MESMTSLYEVIFSKLCDVIPITACIGLATVGIKFAMMFVKGESTTVIIEQPKPDKKLEKKKEPPKPKDGLEKYFDYEVKD